MEELRLPLERAELDVVLEGKNGETKNWRMLELIGSERNKYLNQMKNRMVMKGGNAIAIKNFDGFQSDLLCRMLSDKQTGDPIPREEIEELPAATQHTLFKRAQELSGLNEDAEGND